MREKLELGNEVVRWSMIETCFIYEEIPSHIFISEGIIRSINRRKNGVKIRRDL